MLALLSVHRLSCFVYNHESREVVPPPVDTPWPILWLMAAFHPKHTFCGKKLPELDEVRKSMVSFENKVKWRWHFRASNEPRPLLVVKPPGQVTASFPFLVDPALTRWLSECRGRVMAACKKAFSQARNAPVHCNVHAVVPWARRLMDRLGLALLPNDKDPGFSLMHRSVLVELHSEILQKNDYNEVSPIILDKTKFMQEYCSLCFCVSKLEGDSRLGYELRKSTAGSMTATLVLRLKSHKKAGKVEARNVHASPCYAFLGLATWVTHVLDHELRQFSHLLLGTDDFVDRVKNMVVTPNTVLYRADLKHFFMSGSPVDLTKACNMLPNGPRKILLQRVVLWLLSHQFVTSPHHPGRLWEVVVGSGMGLKHSSAVADATLLVLGEVTFALKASVCDAHQVSNYCRFRDDIFFTGEVRSLAREFFGEIKTRIAAVFDVEMVEVSMSNVDMLAVNVFKEGMYRLGTRPRPRVQGPPLSGESAHPRCVHVHWPQATVKMKKRWCTRKEDAEKVQADLVNRFHAYGLTSNLPRVESTAVLSHSRASTANDTMWLSLGFHPVLQQAKIGAALNSFMLDQQWRDVYRYAFQGLEPPERIRVAWRSVLPKALFLFQKPMR